MIIADKRNSNNGTPPPHADLGSGTTFYSLVMKYMCTVSAHVKKARVADNKVSRGNSEYWVILKISLLLRHCKQLHSSIATQV